MPTVAECWEYYRQLHLHTIIDYAGCVRRWKPIGAWFGDHDAESLTPMEVEAYIKSRPVSQGSLNRELSLLRSCLRHAERHGIIGRAPPIKALPRVAPKPRAITQDQVRTLLDAADKSGNWRAQAFVRLALGTGARPGAICDLTWDRVKDVVDLRVANSKSHRMKRRAVVPINRLITEALKIAEKHRNGPYVLNYQGKKMADPRRLMGQLAKSAKIKGCSAHVLRHTVASFLIAKGEDLLKVSRLLGHASTTITEQVYVHTPPSWLKKTSQLLEEL